MTPPKKDSKQLDRETLDLNVLLAQSEFFRTGKKKKYEIRDTEEEKTHESAPATSPKLSSTSSGDLPSVRSMTSSSIGEASARSMTTRTADTKSARSMASLAADTISARGTVTSIDTTSARNKSSHSSIAAPLGQMENPNHTYKPKGTNVVPETQTIPPPKHEEMKTQTNSTTKSEPKDDDDCCSWGCTWHM